MLPYLLLVRTKRGDDAQKGRPESVGNSERPFSCVCCLVNQSSSSFCWYWLASRESPEGHRNRCAVALVHLPASGFLASEHHE
jgi:hypothetical protein